MFAGVRWLSLGQWAMRQPEHLARSMTEELIRVLVKLGGQIGACACGAARAGVVSLCAQPQRWFEMCLDHKPQANPALPRKFGLHFLPTHSAETRCGRWREDCVFRISTTGCREWGASM